MGTLARPGSDKSVQSMGLQTNSGMIQGRDGGAGAPAQARTELVVALGAPPPGVDRSVSFLLLPNLSTVHILDFIVLQLLLNVRRGGLTCEVCEIDEDSQACR